MITGYSWSNSLLALSVLVLASTLSSAADPDIPFIKIKSISFVEQLFAGTTSNNQQIIENTKVE